MRSLRILGPLLILLVGACTESSDPAPATATRLEPVATSTPPITETTTTTTTTTTVDALPDPTLPGPVEVAEQGWGEIAGFTLTELDEAEIHAVELRLSSLLGTAIQGLSYTGLNSNAGGERVVGLSMSPAEFLRGDPFLAPGLAGSLAGPFEDVEDITIDERAAYRIYLGDSWWYFWASNTHLYATIGPEVEAEQALAATISGSPRQYMWQAGDCLWFGIGDDTSMPYAPYGDAHVVPCSGPHTHEVIFSTQTGYGPNDDHPGEEFGTEVERSCGTAFRSYVGVDWPDSKVTAIRYLPDPAEWDEGDRYTACVVELSDPSGGATRIVGTLEGLGTAALIDRSPGDCHLGTLNSDPVDCKFAHTAQFIGFVEDPTPAGSPYPGIADLLGSQTRECEALVEAFAEVVEKDGATVAADLVPPSVVEWEDDLRTYRCYGIAVDGEGQRLEISGSFDGDWGIVRFSEDDVTA